MFFKGLQVELEQVKYLHSDIFNMPYCLGDVSIHGAFALCAGIQKLVCK